MLMLLGVLLSIAAMGVSHGEEPDARTDRANTITPFAVGSGV
jgi:hypothetical protein